MLHRLFILYFIPLSPLQNFSFSSFDDVQQTSDTEMVLIVCVRGLDLVLREWEEMKRKPTHRDQ